MGDSLLHKYAARQRGDFLPLEEAHDLALKWYTNKDEQALDALMVDKAKLGLYVVRPLVVGLKESDLDIEGIEDYAAFGLIRGIEGYAEDVLSVKELKGNLNTYAGNGALWEACNSIRDNNPQQLSDHQRAITKTLQAVETALGRSLRTSEVAQTVSVLASDKYVAAYHRRKVGNTRPFSNTFLRVSNSHPDHDSAPDRQYSVRFTGDHVIDQSLSDPYDLALLLEQREAIDQALSKLGKRKECVIRERFGLSSDGKEKTLEEVGRLLDPPVTRERIRNMEAEAFRKIRHRARLDISCALPDFANTEFFGEADDLPETQESAEDFDDGGWVSPQFQHLYD